MTEKITLDLPDEVVQRAKTTAERTHRPIQDVLTEWVSRGADRDLESLLLPNTEYQIYTPLGNEEAAQILLEELKEYKAKKGENSDHATGL
jgi:hypothetical protein